jgi:hypothetical protein
MVMKNLLKDTITGDETWFYGYNVATNLHSSQWMGKGFPGTKMHGGVGQG